MANIFTIRGRGRSHRAKSTNCSQCGDVLNISEQYFYDHDHRVTLCLGCFSINKHFNNIGAMPYIPSTDQC